MLTNSIMEFPRAWPNSSDDNQSQRPTKRARVALACTRCKNRKQKCDGHHPTCGKCKSLDTECVYVIPAKPMPFGKNHYLRTLEERVQELEEYLSKQGLLQEVGERQYFPKPATAAVSEDSPSTSLDLDRSHQHRRTSASSDGDASDSQNGIDSMVGVLRDLSLDANGGYIGASGSITIGRLVGSIVTGQERNQSSPVEHFVPHTLRDDVEPAQDFQLSDVPSSVSDRLIVGYMKHISTRWPILHSEHIRDLHARRAVIDDIYEKSILHLIYATGGRFLETTGETGAYFPERHHAAALQNLDPILRFHDTRSVVLLALLAVYCLRSPRGPGAWTYVGLAMRIAIDLGLHRQTSAMNHFGLNVEMRKRIFWSLYAFDRQVSIPLGRPFSISDRDIDVQMPLDVDEAATDISLFEQASKKDPNVVPTTSTSLSSFLHVLKLRRIESSIQQTVYRVDNTEGVSDAEVDQFLSELARWKDLIPLDTRKKVDRDAVAFDGYDYYMIFYYKCLRLLLYPQISKPHQEVNRRFLKAAAEASGGICQTYKRLHQSMSVGYSLMALQTVFMAGLTLIYASWISPEDIYTTSTSNDINACSIVLFVITERWPGARKYRDSFELVRSTVMDLIAEGRHKPRQVIGGLVSSLQTTLRNVEMGEEEQEFTRIVTDMAGERFDQQPESFGTAPEYQSQFLGSHELPTSPSPNTEIPRLGGFDNSAIGIGFDSVPSASIDFSSGFDLETYLTMSSEPFQAFSR